jgi:hypothetical protein
VSFVNLRIHWHSLHLRLQPRLKHSILRPIPSLLPRHACRPGTPEIMVQSSLEAAHQAYPTYDWRHCTNRPASLSSVQVVSYMREVPCCSNGRRLFRIVLYLFHYDHHQSCVSVSWSFRLPQSSITLQTVTGGMPQVSEATMPTCTSSHEIL